MAAVDGDQVVAALVSAARRPRRGVVVGSRAGLGRPRFVLPAPRDPYRVVYEGDIQGAYGHTLRELGFAPVSQVPLGGYVDHSRVIHLPRGRSREHKFALAHEVAHLLDRDALSEGDRNYFSRILGVPKGRPWLWDGKGARGVGQEYFADYYAAAALGLDLSRESISSYVGLERGRLAKFVRAMDRLARRQSLEPYRLRLP